MTNKRFCVAPADDGPAPQMIELRSQDGDLVRKVHAAAAQGIVDRTLGEWVGSGRRRYVRLAKALHAPATSVGAWYGGSKTTQRIRNEWGVICAPDKHVEHRPLPALPRA
jgi:hypothetical protein